MRPNNCTNTFLKALSICVINITFFTNIGFSQGFNFEFAKSFGGPYEEHIYDMCMDNSNNTIIVGDFAGSVDFDPSSVENIKTSEGQTDVYIAKFDPNGNLLWVQTIGNGYYDFANGVGVDSNGNLFLSGTFYYNLDVDPSINNYTINSSSQHQQSYVTKFDSLGNFQWVYYEYNYWGSNANKICVNNADEIILGYIPGWYLNSGNEIRKLSNSGQIIWSKSLAANVLNDIKVDSENNIYIGTTYSTNAPINLVSPPGNFIVNGNGGGVLKFNNSGDFLLGLNFEINYNNITFGVSNSGEIFVSAFTINSPDLDPDQQITFAFSNNPQCFLAKYSTTGTFLWAKSFDILPTENYSQIIFSSISCASNGNILLSGYFAGNIDLDPSLSSEVLINTNYYTAVDLLSLKLNQNGNYIDHVQIGNNQNMIIPKKSIVNQQEEMYTVGIFSNSINFNPTSSTSPQTLTSNGGQDIFILKHATCTPLQWYSDMDNDGYGVGIPITTCWQPAGYVLLNGDYDDTNPNYNPGVTEICDNVDNNGDGNIDEGFDLDGDGHAWCAGDTNDSNPLIYPGAPEICDGLDNNINGSTDEGYDLDGDGFTTCGGDINDNNPTIHPGAQELCDGLDNNQNDIVDEEFDMDADGYSTCQGDSNDNNPNVNPGATETCNSIDDNSNGIIDEGFDLDLDGYSVCQGDCNDNDSSVNQIAVDICNFQDDNCNGLIDEESDLDGDGFTFCNGDCNDFNALINPNGTEVCNGIDDNCNITIDDLEDSDNDGFTACTGDCNDSDSTINPEALELCNSLDDNCDSSIDEGFDNDNDGYSICQGDCDDSSLAINPAANEILDNSIDENCDGSIDLLISEKDVFDVRIYPNPAKDYLVIESKQQSIFFRISNLNGELVETGQINFNPTYIDISDLSKGFYTVEIKNETIIFLKN